MSAARIGLSTTTIEPSLTGGRLDGIGVYSRALLEHLPAAGCAVVPYSFARPGRGAGLSVGRPMAHSFPVATLIDLATPAAVRAALPVDLFHATDYRVIRLACPVVATLHDALPISHPEWCNPRLRGLKNWLQTKAARKADHVIAHTEYSIAELVQCFGVDERRISVVPAGVDEAWLERPAEADIAATLAAHGLRPGYYLFVGTLQPRKNGERLLAAYLALPPVVRAARQLVIVGAAGARSDTLIAQMKAAIQNGENIVWLSALTDTEQLRRVYAAAGVFVFPSLYEGFGIPVVEAFASGVPVIASNTTSLPEVTQGAAVDVDPLSVPELSAAMLALVREDALRARCIAAGQRRALQLTWSETARKTAAVYHTVLSS
ncbi:glycosyltransferase family 1 protein [Rugamonas sp.]|uniref:glycosyltransferase family 4 protein n=1 Tax=Rugamonas sp. TaxID=1926287 RepID=UPI0025D2F25F|nr:glycosyltransferase family 1 protein [Rugamonas sp.]